MKKIRILSILFLLVFTTCDAQNKNKAEKHSIQGQPQTDIKVNKEYDKDGNLIRFDSTYSYYYSNIENDTIIKDSILNKFKDHFKDKYIFSEDPFFNDLFFQDSLINFDFYTKDFFINRFRNNETIMNKLLLEMDSIKNLFFIKQFQDTISKQKK